MIRLADTTTLLLLISVILNYEILFLQAEGLPPVPPGYICADPLVVWSWPTRDGCYGDCEVCDCPTIDYLSIGEPSGQRIRTRVCGLGQKNLSVESTILPLSPQAMEGSSCFAPDSTITVSSDDDLDALLNAADRMIFYVIAL
ncbi:hypothetical protein KIN20_012745 [Parelaphostrongylus tenuis]|uniref:Uncharacterized protein n=1 Tax=Parelaphostrongylus tenuis TaxID=148309 RepID=A0AAD5MWM0_PARTN|nr:hypothetical protein KIN20_012745 [Parelaphostrongylus tenuis]